MNTRKTWILIDDDAQALGSLALAAKAEQIAVEIIWANSSPEMESGLDTLARDSDGLITLNQAASQQALADCIQKHCCLRNCIIVTDLNMDRIALSATTDEGWGNNANIVVEAICAFAAEDSGRQVFIHHSGHGNAEKIANRLSTLERRVIALTKSFEQDKSLVRGKQVAAEILSRLKDLEKTPLERLWSNESTFEWFYRGVVPHNFASIAHADLDRYKVAISSALEVGDIPESWLTAVFHESLKHLAGAYFCGSEPRNGIQPYKRLTFGAVAIIAEIAYFHARKSHIPLVTEFWTEAAEPRAQNHFLEHAEKEKTRTAAIALYRALFHVFEADEKHPNCELIAVSWLGDGLQLTLNWPTAALAESVKAILSAWAASAPVTDRGLVISGRSSSCQALASAMSLLVCSSTRIEIAADNRIVLKWSGVR